MQFDRSAELNAGWTDFKGGNVSEAMKDANEQTFLIVQVETREAYEIL